MTKREKTCSKCHRITKGHPLPIGVNCELTIEKYVVNVKILLKDIQNPQVQIVSLEDV